MSKVQRVPRELLALLGIVGENPPSVMLDELRGTVEMINLILAELPLEEEFTSNAAAVTGTNVTVTVPPGEVWFVEGVLGQVTVSPDDNHISVWWSAAGLADVVYIDGVSKVPGSQNQQCVYVPHPFPLIAKAGNEFHATLRNTDAAGAQTLVCFVSFRRILV